MNDYIQTMPPSEPAPAISVVVCTRDRPEDLRRCLESLARLAYPAYEVIVVDNASRDEATERIVAATPFCYVREERPGLDWARNRGAEVAQHAIVAYVDDDVQVAPDWLGSVSAVFSDPQVAAMTGRVLPAELETRAQRLFEQYSGMSKGDQARIFQRAAMQAHELIAAHHVGVGANMAFRRHALLDVGGFDTALDVGTPAGGGGDLDMFHRLLVAGFTLQYAPSATVWHRHRRDMSGLRQQLYQNGRSFGVYLIKIWLHKSVGRYDVAHFAARWVVGWLLARLLRCLLGHLRFPLALVWAELWGALHAPGAYAATYLHDRAIRRHYTARQDSGLPRKANV